MRYASFLEPVIERVIARFLNNRDSRIISLLASKRSEHAAGFYTSRAHGKQEALAPPKRGLPCPRACSWYGQTMEHLYGRLHKCPSCGIIVRKNGEDLEIKQTGLGLTKSL